MSEQPRRATVWWNDAHHYDWRDYEFIPRSIIAHVVEYLSPEA